ncbi:MFS transporter [Allostreptomyces psammosilenae]|uniref:EmrB/QacA subfamily drug resistance transporter n=1 Tax=Allostreptomyces psammosilenae TaxID=1892865 RepID=A0A852ZZF3_9ACTN|nr:MFS transporter [Allostreptomyces psammosilenae]NYI07529.1 EmrB/QacA subfamily drug resistance transporter [Allostreptomyces psammosilenae]
MAASPPNTTEPDPRRWRMLPLILVATFMAQFDFFAVNVAAPVLRDDLHVDDAALELVVAGYAFTYASGMVTGGRLGDLFGYRRLFLIGVAAFALASLLCGIAATPGQLVAARLLQGLTGAVMVPQVLALITAGFPVHERSRALTWYGITGGVASIAGQVLGGLLLDADLFGLSWRNIFLVNVPVGLVLVIVAPRLLPAVAKAGHRPRLDPLGAVAISAGLALALVPLALGHAEGWPLWTWISLAASLPVLLLAIAWERRLTRRGGDPLLDLTLFRDRAFSGGLAVNVAFMAYWGGFMFVLALFLQSGLGLSPTAAGLTFAPLGITFMATTFLGRRLSVRRGPVPVMALGFTLSGVGLLALTAGLAVAGDGAGPVLVATTLGVVGLGNGLVMALLVGAVLSGVRPARAGAASGVLTTTQQFASATGVAVLGAVFFSVLGPDPDRAGYASTTALIMAGAAGLLLVALALLRLLRTGARPAVAGAGSGGGGGTGGGAGGATRPAPVEERRLVPAEAAEAPARAE